MIQLINWILKVVCTVIFIFIAILKVIIVIILADDSLIRDSNTMNYIWGEDWYKSEIEI